MKDAFIYDAIRTPRGKAREDGALHDVSAFDLLAALYNALEQRNQLEPGNIDDIVMGCVTQNAEQAGNIAKTSSLYAGWPETVPGITVNRYCSSGLDAINIAALKVVSGMNNLVVAGGIEMMSRVPMLSDNANAFTDVKLASKMGMYMMGCGADLIASLHHVNRQQADAVALASQQRAAHASENGYFRSVIAIENPVKETIVSKDECIRAQTTIASLATMAPAFTTLGAMGTDAIYLKRYPHLNEIQHVHTAGNSPAMADAAATVLIGDESAGKQLSTPARARIVAMTNCNDDIRSVVGGCVAATAKLMKQENLTPDDIDLFEIHEAFAATMIRCQQELKISNDKLNVNGGCIALGHPLGATGAIMMGTLLDELERRELKRGIVAASGAAGAGTACLIERA